MLDVIFSGTTFTTATSPSPQLHPGLRIRIHFIWMRIRIHFIWIRIRIQHFRMNNNPDPDPIRIQGFNDQNWRKKLQLKKKLNFFISKTAIYLSLGLHKVCPSYRRSLQLSKEAIQHFKTWTFTNFFCTFVGHFCPPPDPLTRLNPDPIRIRIRNPGYIAITTDTLLSQKPPRSQ